MEEFSSDLEGLTAVGTDFPTQTPGKPNTAEVLFFTYCAGGSDPQDKSKNRGAVLSPPCDLDVALELGSRENYPAGPAVSPR